MPTAAFAAPVIDHSPEADTFRHIPCNKTGSQLGMYNNVSNAETLLAMVTSIGSEYMPLT